jgi:hypothetical protein
MAGNTKRLVKKGAVVIRDGKRVRPEIGKVFPFTAEEAKALNEATPGTLAPASEAEIEESEGVAATTTTTTSSAEGSQASAKGGKKAATANKSDAEAAGDDDL